MNLFESIVADIRRPDAPPHTGEAFFLWVYDVAVREARSVVMVLCNHTQDRDLLELMEHFIDDVMDPQIKRVEPMLREAGITPPAAVSDPPKADATQIPAGARFAEVTAARMLLVKVQGLLDLASNGMRFCNRTDIAGMFMAFVTQVSAQGYTMRETLLKRGWLPQAPTFGESGRTSQ